MPLSEELLTVAAAAKKLGVTAPTLYDWLGRSDYGLLEIRGRRVVIAYYQSGARGQGRIRIPTSEVERLLEAMRVTPCTAPQPRPVLRPKNFPGISVPLGRPKS